MLPFLRKKITHQEYADLKELHNLRQRVAYYERLSDSLLERIKRHEDELDKLCEYLQTLEDHEAEIQRLSAALAIRNDYDLLLAEKREIVMTPEFLHCIDHATTAAAPTFITGPAGTGKSTLLRLLRENFMGGYALSAPTGVAAANIGGQTLHSLFKLPPLRFPPGGATSYSSLLKRRDGENSTLLQALRFLVIDEVSMATPDLIDHIDLTLRIGRDSAEPFGGCKLVLVGDMGQLPPVYTEKSDPGGQTDLQFNRKYYQKDTPYFFDARVFKKARIKTLYLTHIFRQTDVTFARTLSRIRLNQQAQADIAYLNIRHTNANLATEERQRTYIFPTNRQCDGHNSKMLQQLPGQEIKFKMLCEGRVSDSDKKNSKYEECLVLKKGARIMMLDNCGALYSNGTIGEIAEIDEQNETITISLRSGTFQISRAQQELLETVVEEGQLAHRPRGWIYQFPLKLAWAITIHKSQGTTLDSGYIDTSGVWAHGQAYVALSRVRTHQGLNLVRRVSASAIRLDKNLQDWL